MQFFSYLINGISLGSVYALIALGYTMVYGIAKMLNFAHGDVIMVGAYISFCVTNYLGLPVVVSILAAMAVCTLLGVLIEGLAYKPLRGTPSLAVLITAIGVSYFLQNAAQLIWSSSPKNFTSIVTFQPLRLAASWPMTPTAISRSSRQMCGRPLPNSKNAVSSRSNSSPRATASRCWNAMPVTCTTAASSSRSAANTTPRRWNRSSSSHAAAYR